MIHCENKNAIDFSNNANIIVKLNILMWFFIWLEILWTQVWCASIRSTLTRVCLIWYQDCERGENWAFKEDSRFGYLHNVWGENYQLGSYYTGPHI